MNIIQFKQCIETSFITDQSSISDVACLKASKINFNGLMPINVRFESDTIRFKLVITKHEMREYLKNIMFPITSSDALNYLNEMFFT